MERHTRVPVRFDANAKRIEYEQKQKLIEEAAKNKKRAKSGPKAGKRAQDSTNAQDKKRNAKRRQEIKAAMQVPSSKTGYTYWKSLTKREGSACSTTGTQ